MLQSITVLQNTMPQSFSLSPSLSTGSDFTNEYFVVEIPANEESDGPSEFVLEQQFHILDDDIDEVVQSFVLVAEIGTDVREDFTCFQRTSQSFIAAAEIFESCTCLQRAENETGCNANMEATARFGATRIHIYDDDGRFNSHTLIMFNTIAKMYALINIAFSILPL